MKKRVFKIVLIVALILAGSSTVFAQSINALKAEIKRAEEEIRVNTALLDKTRKDAKVNQSQLKLIQSRITSRKNIISSLEKQISIINRDINSKSKQVGGLEKELTELKKAYGEMLYTTYKNYKLNNFLVFIFASTDFNDMTKRVSFMKRYNKMREVKAAQIDSLSQRLGSQIKELDSKRTELGEVKNSRSKEVSSMASDETQYKKAVAELKSTESKLSSAVKAKQAQIKKAQQQIEKIIAEEARKAKSTKRSAAEKQQDVVLTGKFDQNKGKLPYPVRGGVVIDGYGVHEHPTQKGLKINNKGINIAAEGGAEVRCVFEGVVSRIFFFQGLNNSVMVRHGNYITVYSNLASVSVKTGDKVALNQTLGRIASSDDSDENMLHFEIWKEMTNLNPSLWLRR